MNDLVAIGAEASRIREDSIYSSKSHFEASRRWGRIHMSLGLPAAVAAAVSGVSALSDLSVVAAVLAFSVASLAAVMTFLNPEKRSASHLAAGQQFLALRNRVRIFENVDLMQLDVASATSALKAFSDQRDELNVSSPLIPRWAFLAARKGIKSGESMHAIDRSPTEDPKVES